MKNKSLYNVIRALVILAFILSVGQNVIYATKYNEAVDALLVCSTSQYSKVEEEVAPIAENNSLTKAIHGEKTEMSIRSDAGRELLNDLSRKAENLGISKDKIVQDLKESGLQDNATENTKKK